MCNRSFGYDNHVDIDYYVQCGYKPDWKTLPDCPGTGPKKSDNEFK